MTKNQLLVLMGSRNRIAERRFEMNREVWRIKNEDGVWLPCSPAIRQLKEADFLWFHYPSGSASAGLNDKGKYAYKNLIARFPKYATEES